MKKLKWIIIYGLLIVVTCLSVYFIWNHFKDNDNISDNIRFANEYTNIPQNNVFVYATQDEIINTLKSGTGVIYLGFPECPWCQKYVNYTNEIAKEMGISKIYYYNIREDRNNNTEFYQEVVSILSNYLFNDVNNNKRIYVPDLTVVKNGNITSHNNETSLIDSNSMMPQDYWTTDKINEFKTVLRNMFSTLGTCTTCN